MSTLTKEIKETIRAIPESRLAEMWCELNSWKRPAELKDILPEDFRSYTEDKIAYTLSWQVMEYILFVISDKAVSRYWNRKEMNKEKFEEWYTRHGEK